MSSSNCTSNQDERLTYSVSDALSFFNLISSASSFWKAACLRDSSLWTALNRCSSRRNFCLSASSVRSSTETRSGRRGFEWFVSCCKALSLASNIGGCACVGDDLCFSINSLNSLSGPMASTRVLSNANSKRNGSELKSECWEISLMTAWHWRRMSSCTACWNSNRPATHTIAYKRRI